MEVVYKKSAAAECSNYHERSHSSTTLNILSDIILSRLTSYKVEITGLVEFDATGQLLILCFAIVDYLKKIKYNEAVHHTYIAFKKDYDSVRKEVLFNVLIEFCMPMKLIILIKCV
jgi:hypothetical protein